jgi:hypothetical protein
MDDFGQLFFGGHGGRKRKVDSRKLKAAARRAHVTIPGSTAAEKQADSLDAKRNAAEREGEFPEKMAVFVARPSSAD